MMLHEEAENRAAKPVTTSKSGTPEEPTEGRGADRVAPIGDQTPQEAKSLVEEQVETYKTKNAIGTAVYGTVRTVV